MNRTVTREDIEAAWEAMAPIAVDEFNSKGEVSPKLFMLTSATNRATSSRSARSILASFTRCSTRK